MAMRTPAQKPRGLARITFIGSNCTRWNQLGERGSQVRRPEAGSLPDFAVVPPDDVHAIVDNPTGGGAANLRERRHFAPSVPPRIECVYICSSYIMRTLSAGRNDVAVVEDAGGECEMRIRARQRRLRGPRVGRDVISMH